MGLLMIRAILFTFSNRLLNSFIKLSIYFFCFYIIFPNYSDANDLLAQKSSNPNLTGHTTSFSFIVWGHPRGAKNGDPPLLLDEFTNLVRELKPDFIVITGDMIQGRLSVKVKQTKELMRKDWDYFDDCIKRFGVPVYRLPGNHDVSNFLTRDVYFERYPRPPFSFTYKGSRFILLDSCGIDQRSNDSSRTWQGLAMPFDDNQIDFIKREILSQDSFNHIFFFMHHTSPWSESDSAWWKDVHPLLVGGKTRAVFSGDNPSWMKFAHIEQDGIHYLLNNSYPTMGVDYYKTYIRHGTDNLFCTMRQMDNVQFVQVKGDKVNYKTHVFGELSKESLSWRYYDRIEKELSTWKKRTWKLRLLAKFKEKLFYRPKSTVLVFIVFGGGCFLFGILFILLLIRPKNK